MADQPAVPAGRVVGVVPDVAGINKVLDYLVPAEMAARVRVGTMVRIPLHGRRVGGWVVDDDVEPPAGVVLRPLAKVTGWGPPADLVDLAGWAAWRWAGRRSQLLRTASPDFAVRGLPPAVGGVGPVGRAGATTAGAISADEITADEITAAFAVPRAVLRMPPAADLLPVVLTAAARGPALVVAATGASGLGGRLREAGIPVALLPRDWAQAAAGAPVVVGARAAAWAPCAGLASVVVLDGHEEALQQEQAPTWNAWVVAAERACRAGVPCVVVSSCPTVELLAWPGASLVVPSRATERAGWARLEVLDRRRDDPRTGLYSPRLVSVVRDGGAVVCVLNRRGRARLLACAVCREVARCERCGAAVSHVGDELVCGRCATVRPLVCLHCGSSRLKTLRVGVTRAREELEALAGRPVGEVTAGTGPLPGTTVLVGTEAVLHRVEAADAVAFLDFDQELLAPRYRASEEALALLARASRMVGGRHRDGRVLVQTRVPRHETLVAAVNADPGRLAAGDAATRHALRLPPAVAAAVVSGEGAKEYVAGLTGVEILGPDGDRWLVKAGDHDALSTALSAVARPSGRLRVEVDPLRL